jgi:hypothetical protein
MHFTDCVRMTLFSIHDCLLVSLLDDVVLRIYLVLLLFRDDGWILLFEFHLGEKIKTF